jgi:hypothetical protein
MKSLLRLSHIAMFVTALLFADRGFAESVRRHYTVARTDSC